jgi:hypothetical protein
LEYVSRSGEKRSGSRITKDVGRHKEIGEVMQSSIEQMHDYLETNVGDWVARGALGDLYEEAGNLVMGSGYHWMAGNRRRPWKIADPLGWSWSPYNEYQGFENILSMVRTVIYEKLIGKNCLYYKWYSTIREAEADLCRVLAMNVITISK